MIKVPSIMKPNTLVVQAKPILGRSLWNTIGKITPPNDDPDAAMPMANPTFVEKYVDRMATLGTKRAPVPRPEHGISALVGMKAHALCHRLPTNTECLRQ